MSEPNACCQEWRDECNKHLSRIAELDQQVAALTKENERLKTVPMKYRRMEFNAQLQNQLSASQAREARLRDAMDTCDRDCIRAALALPTDDSALQARLKEEREKCAERIEAVEGEWLTKVAASALIRSMT